MPASWEIREQPQKCCIKSHAGRCLAAGRRLSSQRLVTSLGSSFLLRPLTLELCLPVRDEDTGRRECGAGSERRGSDQGERSRA